MRRMVGQRLFMHTEQMVVGFDHKGAVDVCQSEI